MHGRRRGSSMALAALVGAFTAFGALALQPVIGLGVQAQGGSDVWVIPLTARGDTLSVGEPRNLTQRPGYDNQPAFVPNGSAILYTSIREDAQADIWRVSTSGGTPTRLTITPESEYSATPMPHGRGFSVIRVEADSTQRLWEFDWYGTARSVILPGLKPVGYHVWVNSRQLGAFVLGSPNALVLADVPTNRVDTLARGIGRAFAKVPGIDAFSFVHFHGDTSVIGSVDALTGGVRRITYPPPGGEYHVILPDGAMIASSGSRLYHSDGGEWRVLADLSAFGVRNITRLALSPQRDQLAFVADDSAAP
jgi:WD40 repeat protein